MPPEAPNCAFKPCHCQVDSADAVEHAGKTYCSERCIDGRGCDHAHCNCGEFPTAEPDLRDADTGSGQPVVTR